MRRLKAVSGKHISYILEQEHYPISTQLNGVERERVEQRTWVFLGLWSISPPPRMDSLGSNCDICPVYRPLLPLALQTFGVSSDPDILREVARLLGLCVPLLKELGGLSHVAPTLSPKILFVLASSTQLPLIVQVRKSTTEVSGA